MAKVEGGTFGRGLAFSRIEQITADRARFREAAGFGVGTTMRIVSAPLKELGGEKDSFTEKDIDELTATLWV